MHEGVENFLLPHDKLNLEKFSIPFLLFLFYHLALSFPSACTIVLYSFSSRRLLHKDALPPLSSEVSYLFRDTICYTDRSHCLQHVLTVSFGFTEGFSVSYPLLFTSTGVQCW